MAERHRIGKVTTRSGDTGNSRLATGRTLGKHHPVFQAVGSVDELNSHVGMLVSLLRQNDTAAGSDEQFEALFNIQQALFDIGAVLAMEGQYDAPDYNPLEGWVEAMNRALPKLTEFVLPGGGVEASQSHICRTVCRRAETAMWHLTEVSDNTPDSYIHAAQYLNRLSDYFFVLARTLTVVSETQWQGPQQG